MANKISNSAKRKLEVLKRSAFPNGCLVNRKWCYALTSENPVKSLIKNEHVKLVRDRANVGCAYSMLKITPKGRKYLEELEKMAPTAK
jgi:hypothetical protein